MKILSKSSREILCILIYFKYLDLSIIIIIKVFVIMNRNIIVVALVVAFIIFNIIVIIVNKSTFVIIQILP